MANTKPVYIYKDGEGLEKYDGIIKWHKDPNKIIEELFFKYHYPCMSFVAISGNGEFISFFGEFGKETVWTAVEILNNE